MIYEKGNKNMVVTRDLQPPIPRPLEVNEDPEILESRRAFLVIVGVVLGFVFLSVPNTIKEIIAICEFIGIPHLDYLVFLFIGILVHVFGFLAGYGYSPTCLHLFASVSIMMYIIHSIAILVGLCVRGTTSSVAIPLHSSETQHPVINLPVTFLTGVLLFSIIASLILLVFIVKLSLKLAKLIRKKEPVFFPPV